MPAPPVHCNPPRKPEPKSGSNKFLRCCNRKPCCATRSFEQYLRRAELAESEDNKRMARANYRSAIAIAPEPLRTQLQQRLQAMMNRPSDDE